MYNRKMMENDDISRPSRPSQLYNILARHDDMVTFFSIITRVRKIKNRPFLQITFGTS